ncbi:hypothetical protein H3V53_00470 [Paraburkholderia bengalensis]|uniref:Uncharacterized protein n=1 Tax=Paraburkholderia bengalensis TaxID=2747562 RepID=A0ABU8IJN8_9BURK
MIGRLGRGALSIVEVAAKAAQAVDALCRNLVFDGRVKQLSRGGFNKSRSAQASGKRKSVAFPPTPGGGGDGEHTVRIHGDATYAHCR